MDGVLCTYRNPIRTEGVRGMDTSKVAPVSLASMETSSDKDSGTAGIRPPGTACLRNCEHAKRRMAHLSDSPLTQSPRNRLLEIPRSQEFNSKIQRTSSRLANRLVRNRMLGGVSGRGLAAPSDSIQEQKNQIRGAFPCLTPKRDRRKMFPTSRPRFGHVRRKTATVG